MLWLFYLGLSVASMYNACAPPPGNLLLLEQRAGPMLPHTFPKEGVDEVRKVLHLFICGGWCGWVQRHTVTLTKGNVVGFHMCSPRPSVCQLTNEQDAPP